MTLFLFVILFFFLSDSDIFDWGFTYSGLFCVVGRKTFNIISNESVVFTTSAPTPILTQQPTPKFAQLSSTQGKDIRKKKIMI
jgi:hypothetical protein